MGSTYHVQVVLGMELKLETIMETIGWWLKSTKQDIWQSNLQSMEETLCTRWLLFLAEEYDCKARSWELWNLKGVNVALI